MATQQAAALTAANASRCLDCGREVGQPLTGRRRVLCQDCRIRRAGLGRLRQARQLFDEIHDHHVSAVIDQAILTAGPIRPT